MRTRLHALWRHVTSQHTSPGRIGVAVFVGIVLGVVPLYGIQTPICLAVAHLTRLNKVTVVLAANISNPFVAPFLVAAGIVIGEYVRFGELHPLDLGQANTFLGQLGLLGGELPDLFLSCLIGDTLLGLFLGIVFGVIAYSIARARLPTEPVG